jgi:hypothetical protein
VEGFLTAGSGLRTLWDWQAVGEASWVLPSASHAADVTDLPPKSWVHSSTFCGTVTASSASDLAAKAGVRTAVLVARVSR